MRRAASSIDDLRRSPRLDLRCIDPCTDLAGRSARRWRRRLRPAPPQDVAASTDALKQREQELEAARIAAEEFAAELQAKLKAEIAAIGEDRSKLNQQLIDIAAQGARRRRPRSPTPKRGCAYWTDASRRFAASLDCAPLRGRRGAGGTAARRPPHAAGPAGAARGRAAIAAHRDAARRGRAGIARAGGDAFRRSRRARRRSQAQSPANAIASLPTATGSATIRRGLAALVEERQSKQADIEKDVDAEGARAVALARQVDDLQGLISKMEQDVKGAAKAAAGRDACRVAAASPIRRC